MRRRSPLRSWAVAVLLAAAAIGPAPVLAEEFSLERCARLVRDEPDDLESYRCYWAVARREGLWEESIRALEALLAIDPQNHRARLYLAAIEADRGHGRAAGLYEEAAAGFEAEGETTGEVYARLSLAYMAKRDGRFDDMDSELRRATEAAERGGDPILLVRVLSSRASYYLDRSDYGLALGLLREAEAAILPNGPSDLQSYVLSALGRAYWALEFRQKALEAYEKEAKILRDSGDRFAEAVPRYNIALLARELWAQGLIEQDEFLERLEESLRLSVESGERKLEALNRMLLGAVRHEPSSAEEYRRAIDLCRQVNEVKCVRAAERLLAETIAKFEPKRRGEAMDLARRTVEDARSSGDLEDSAWCLAARAYLSGEYSVRDEWLAAYREALESVEKIRDLQPEGSVRARVFAKWDFVYHRFVGLLLDGLPSSPDPAGDLDLAVRTIERMRARVLLDELDGAGASLAVKDPGPDRVRREEVLNEIVRLQRELGDPKLPPNRRTADLAELERLEREESALRDAIARKDPAFARLRAPDFPSIAEIQNRLADDQALLSFHLSTREVSPTLHVSNGGSWLIAMTRDSLSAYPLPEKGELAQQVSVFLGMLRRRDGSEVLGAERLGEVLLGDAFREIGDSYRRLVIVPDGCLHRLPFETLRPAPGREPLGLDFELAYAPSITLWTRWEAGGEASPEARVLALADPDLATVLEPSGERTVDPWVEGLRLGPLPHARREARIMVRSLRAGSRLVSGPEATEHFVKSAQLSDFGLLHFAAHAVVDPEKPERSAVLLAPGASDEDGFLQIREIVELDLDGQVVFLTACRSASGTFIEGEGVLGLARAFFQAGARAVVGSLWPLRDDESAALMEEFASHLAQGKSLAGALADARRERIRAGAPVAAWSGLIVVGDGDLVPLPGGESRGIDLTWLLAVSAAVAVVIVVVVYRRRRRASAGG